MKNLKCLPSVLCMLVVVACFHVSVSGQSAEDKNKLANINASGLSVRWDVAAPHSGVTLTISAPDGRVFRKEFRAGGSPEFALTDKQGERLPDGQYTYELRLAPVLSEAVKETLKAARGKDDDAEAVRSTRKHAVLPAEALVQSGGFSIMNGAVIVAGAVEEAGPRPVSKIMERPGLPGAAGAALTKLRRHHLSAIAMPDQVIPDDLIVQGSACVGIDCVNGEVFGFDTIRLKENNTRIQFDDTSVGSFPTNNWQIRANSSASGGASFLAFVDQGASGNTETGTIVFEVDAGAPANSLKVDNLGRVGIRTATPVLDLHMNTPNTPAIRLEQNSSGGFTAQTWDIGANEANFFVRDVTGGSRLPFRIRPGAPTSSIDIAASGNVGIGTASPSSFSKLHIRGSGQTNIFIDENSSNRQDARIFFLQQGTARWQLGADLSSNNTHDFFLFDQNALATRIYVNSSGNVGIGTTAPTDTLSVNGTASKPGGGSWAVFSDERLKNIKGRFTSGLKAVMELQPLRYEYQRSNALGLKSDEEHVGFGAQAVQKIIPEAVTRNENGYLQINNDPILWTMLNAIKEQQKEIVELKKQVRQLRTAARRRK